MPIDDSARRDAASGVASATLAGCHSSMSGPSPIPSALTGSHGSIRPVARLRVRLAPSMVAVYGAARLLARLLARLRVRL